MKGRRGFEKFGRHRFVKAARPAISSAQAVLARVGNAIIGGDFTGNARGDFALDLQVTRSDPAYVASGAAAVALGQDAEASGENSFALGVAVRAAGADSFALGVGVDASYDYSVAFGYGARAPAANTVNIGGLIANKSLSLDYSPALWLRDGAGVAVVIVGGDIRTDIAADHSFSLPANCKFYVRELGFVIDSVPSPLTQPTLRFGVTGNPTKHLAATACTLLIAASQREYFLPAASAWRYGETSLLGGITVPTGAVGHGRFWWSGLFVQDLE